MKIYADENKDTPVIRAIGWDRTWFSGGLQGIYLPIIAKIKGYEFTQEEHHKFLKKTFTYYNEMGYTLLCDCHQVAVPYFADGDMSMFEPYIETTGAKAGTRDPLLWDEEHMKESMALANKAGFNVHTHAMGNYAIHKVIDCYENAQKLYPNPKIRNIIAHCTFITPEDKVRMGKNHIIASNQPSWFSDGHAQPVMTAYWGKDVANKAYPSKSLIDNDVMCAYGSDFPVNAAYGLSGIQVAMTRRNVKLDLAYELYKDFPADMPEECISLKEALQAHLENVTGSIEVGKSAELVVLDSDIENTPPEHIQDIKVLETVFK